MYVGVVFVGVVLKMLVCVDRCVCWYVWEVGLCVAVGVCRFN